jgi:hypothetical protein
MIATDHVYPKDIIEGDGKWAVTNSTKFAASIILIIERLKLKEGEAVVGVRMKVETYKSRFTKISNKIVLEVPYDRGMSYTTGLCDVLEEDGVITKCFGGWSFVDPDTKKEFKIKESQKGKDLDANPEILQRILEVAAAKEIYADIKEDFVSEEMEFIEDAAPVTAEEITSGKKKKAKKSEEE